MIELIKKIWAGPTAVKVSLMFFMFILFCIFIANPFGVIFTGLFVYALYKIVHWLEYGE